MANVCFFFNNTTTAEIYTLSQHDALPIAAVEDEVGGRHQPVADMEGGDAAARAGDLPRHVRVPPDVVHVQRHAGRSEEHTSELQSRQYLVCRLLLEKKTVNASIKR